VIWRDTTHLPPTRCAAHPDRFSCVHSDSGSGSGSVQRQCHCQRQCQRQCEAGTSGRLVSIHNGRYGSVPIEAIVATKKVVDVEKYYNIDRLRPQYKAFNELPLFIMTSDA
jgi:hypothetical protein